MQKLLLGVAAGLTAVCTSAGAQTSGPNHFGTECRVERRSDGKLISFLQVTTWYKERDEVAVLLSQIEVKEEFRTAHGTGTFSQYYNTVPEPSLMIDISQPVPFGYTTDAQGYWQNVIFSFSKGGGTLAPDDQTIPRIPSELGTSIPSDALVGISSRVVIPTATSGEIQITARVPSRELLRRSFRVADAARFYRETRPELTEQQLRGKERLPASCKGTEW